MPGSYVLFHFATVASSMRERTFVCIITQCLYTSTLCTSSTLLTEFLPQYAPKSITISGITR